MEQKKILFVDTVHPLISKELTNAGFICDLISGESYDHYCSIISKYHGVIIRSGITLDSNILSKAVNLRFIGRVGSGMENIDTVYAASKRIQCMNSPEGNRDAVGEHALGMLLALLNNIVVAGIEVKNGLWRREENRGMEIMGKTVAVIGYGNTGSAFAQRLKGFDCKIIAYDKYKTGFGNDYVEEVAEDTVFKKADILSLHVPLNKETEYMADSNYFEKFQKPFILINTARGKVVKTDDLVKAMQNSKILGAALDVIEYEESSFEVVSADPAPEALQYLRKSNNVLMTPHIAGWTMESKYKLAQVLVNKILSLSKNS